MPRFPAADPRIAWLGHIDLDVTAEGVQAWRLPCADRELFHADLAAAAGKPSGVRLRFATDAHEVVLEAVGGAGAPLGATVDGAVAAETVIGSDGMAAVALPGGLRTVELWLPHQTPLRVAALHLPEGAGLAASPPPARRWLTYGSSISHGSGASAPLRTWPARVALAEGLDLVNLGFGGQCHLDPLVARMIAGQRADAISLKAGINIYGQASLGPRTFRANLIAFIRLVREGHPRTPLAVISPVFSPVRETMENRVGMTLVRMRSEVAEAVALLRARGDEALHHLDGLELLGPADLLRLPDHLHPDDEGYALIAARFRARLAPVLFPAAAQAVP